MTDKVLFTKEQQALMESMRIPFAVYQFINKRVVTRILSDGFCELLGYEDKAQAYFQMDHDMYRDAHPDDVARIADAAFRFATEGGRYDVVYRTKKPGGADYRLIHAVGEHVFTASGTRLAYVWYTDEGPYIEDAETPAPALQRFFSDSLHEQSLLRASHYDHLTGLPGMSYFFELAQAGRDAILQDGGRPVMLYINLNGMKFFNTRHGFAEGDRFLCSFAKLLAATFSSENCCHINADHFAAYTREEGLEEKLRQLFQACRALNGGDSLPVRVGIYPSRHENIPTSTACDRAKLACDSIRKSYDSAFHYYDQRLHDDMEKRQYILANLERAMEEHWIQVYYQPIIRAVNGRVCDEEALARWIDPVRGFLSPADFIPYLEDAGLIYRLDLYVVDQVLAKMKRQREYGLHLVPHSVNLSRSDFDACDMVEEIRCRVDAAGMPRDKITIEITESVIGSDFDFMKAQVGRFQSLGFPVWLDDFGAGYSSLDVLQSIQFDLLKFDMSFMQKLDEGDNSKIVLTELMKMATALGVDTVCEGVEKESQVRFLQEIGCSKLQGYYFSRPNSLDTILERYEKGIQIGFENPAESAYYEAIGRVNLYDLAVLTKEDTAEFHNYFNMLPMGILELRDGRVRFVRSNQSYRDFMRRFFSFDLSEDAKDYTASPFGQGSTFMKLVNRCCSEGGRVFFDEKMQDGSIVHSFAKRIGANPVTGTTAVAIAVLSITDEPEGASYADIARALAADYYNLYYVDLETEDFIEYSSPVGEEELAMERHGRHFFEASRRDTMTRIYEADRPAFLSSFTKENILQHLDEQGVFTATYRLVDSGAPMYVSMKAMRMQPDGKHLIIGISIVDAQMKQKEADEKLRQERLVFGRIAALSGNYIVLYTIDPVTDRYYEYSSTDDYRSLGLAKEGDDFFRQSQINGERTIFVEDLPAYMRRFTKENIMRVVRKNRIFRLQYRLMINGEPIPVKLKAALVQESDGEKLILGVEKEKDGEENLF